MRKLFILPIIIAGLALDSGTFAAGPARRGGGSGTSAGTTGGKAPVAARAAKQSGKVNPNAGGKSTGGKTGAQSGGQGNSGSGSKNNAPGKKPNGARAAATQKVIQTGTKITAAKTNTAVSQECQDAFYGCMDSMCMLDNATGGRCQCSDKITELNQIQEEILKLDEQSYIMATEGVERLKMGENADEIMARAKAAGDVAAGNNKKKQEDEKANKIKTLDLSAWNNSIFGQQDEDESDAFDIPADDFVSQIQGKTGEALYRLSARMCAKQITEVCGASASMVQIMYAQNIKSDCTAYENSLKQQKNASAQKLQAAQKALRDTALEEFQNENKYDLGQCTVRFKECMQTTAGCGEDFTGCVTLAAAENVRSSAQKNDDKAQRAKQKQTTIKGAVSSIKLAAATIDQMTAKKPLCESVLKQCKQVKDKVWTTFMAEIAPTLKTAELLAEDNLRTNCISDVSQCFQKACKEYIDPSNPDGSYDMCLSNPMLVVDLCKVKLEPCIEATGGTLGDKESIESSRLWAGIAARLAAMRVDACTNEIKQCLTSEDRCGEDYSQCLGLDTDTIVDMCPADKLTACMKDNKFGTDKAKDNIRNYVAEIAQALALTIDNKMLSNCEKAANKAMIEVCGDADDCTGLVLEDSIGSRNLKYQVCQVINDEASKTVTINTGLCKDRAEQISKAEMGLDTLTAEGKQQLGSLSYGSSSWGFGCLFFGGGRSDSQFKMSFINKTNYSLEKGKAVMYTPYISGYVDWGKNIGISDMAGSNRDKTGKRAEYFTNKASKAAEGDTSSEAYAIWNQTQSIVDSLNASLDRVMNSIESNTQVYRCMNGRELQGISKQTTNKGKTTKEENTLGGTGVDNARFPNLTNSIRMKVANQIYSSILADYTAKLKEYEEKRDEDYLNIASMYSSVAAENDEKELDQRLGTACNSLTKDNSEWNYKEVISAVYSESNNTCTKTTRTQTCKNQIYAGTPGRRTCTEWNAATEKVDVIKM